MNEKGIIMEKKLIQILDEAVGSQLAKGIGEIETDVNLFENGLDSIGFINIIIALENEYDIFIAQDDLDIERFSTIKGIKEYVDSRLDENK